MKRNTLILSAMALTLTALAGCGGGGGGSAPVSRELLAGSTEKTWVLVAIRGNSTYTGGGVDVPCAASLKKTANARISFSCGASETIVMRQSGTFNYRGVGGVSWTISGSTVTLDAGSFGVLTGAITDESVPGESLHRLRVRQVRRTVGGVRSTDDDGCDLIIEDAFRN
jgi:hypothetical protein